MAGTHRRQRDAARRHRALPGENYDNAFWNGEQMVFGDGDNEVLDFTIPVDAIAPGS
ncbi:hypothetical protein LT493_20995 [Streptomyces tricolor]|nr:hypothetical protein [Streptomyces tricolor]